MTTNNGHSGYRNAWSTAGVEQVRDPQTGFITLATGTFYLAIGGSNAVVPSDTSLVSAHLAWNAAFAGAITVETSNSPLYFHGRDNGAVHVSDYEATTVSGGWVPENPSTAIVAVTGASNTSTAATVTAGGAAIGACMYHLGNMGARRVRLKLVVTTGGNIRCNVLGKLGS